MNTELIKPKAGDGVNYVTAEGAVVPAVVVSRSAFPARTDTGSPCDLRLADGTLVRGVKHDAGAGRETWHPADSAKPKAKAPKPAADPA